MSSQPSQVEDIKPLLRSLPPATVQGDVVASMIESSSCTDEEVRAAVARYCSLTCAETREGAKVAAKVKAMTSYHLMSEVSIKNFRASTDTPVLRSSLTTPTLFKRCQNNSSFDSLFSSQRQLSVLLSETCSPSVLRTGPDMTAKREVLLRLSSSFSVMESSRKKTASLMKAKTGCECVKDGTGYRYFEVDGGEEVDAEEYAKRYSLALGIHGHAHDDDEKVEDDVVAEEEEEEKEEVLEISEDQDKEKGDTEEKEIEESPEREEEEVSVDVDDQPKQDEERKKAQELVEEEKSLDDTDKEETESNVASLIAEQDSILFSSIDEALLKYVKTVADIKKAHEGEKEMGIGKLAIRVSSGE